jgi:hypothetical protein
VTVLLSATYRIAHKFRFGVLTADKSYPITVEKICYHLDLEKRHDEWFAYKEIDMSEKNQPDLASQFQEMGENIKKLFQTAWESEEAEKLKEELRNGLAEMGAVTKEAIEDFKESETGQKLKTEAEDIKARVESGELEAKSRQEISKALDLINKELQKVIQKSSKPKGDPE